MLKIIDLLCENCKQLKPDEQISGCEIYDKIRKSNLDVYIQYYIIMHHCHLICLDCKKKNEKQIY